MIPSDDISPTGTLCRLLCREPKSCKLGIFWMALQRSVQTVYGGVDMETVSEAVH